MCDPVLIPEDLVPPGFDPKNKNIENGSNRPTFPLELVRLKDNPITIRHPLLLKCYGVCLFVCLFVCLSDGKVSDGKGIINFLIPGAAAGGRRQKSGKVAICRSG